MTQTLDLREQFTGLDASAATPATTQTKAISKFGTFAITFGIAFAILYTVFERLNWPLFTYHPVTNTVDFWRESTGTGPPMFWYGWNVLTVIGASVIAWIATLVPGEWLRRATLFCCALTALWPLSLEGLRIFITDYATFDADFLNSVWVAAIPGFIAAAAITYFVPQRLADRLWTSWLWVMPVGGFAVLCYSLETWFTR